jgi:ankyrin repeat protein
MQMGETPLIRAAHNGHFQAVKLLVDSGADVNALDMVSASRCSGAGGLVA